MGCGASSAAAGGSAIVPGLQVAEQREPRPAPVTDTPHDRAVHAAAPAPAPTPAPAEPDKTPPLEPSASGPKPIQPEPGAYVRKKSKRRPQVDTPAPARLIPRAPEPESEPDWSLLANDPAELTRRVCAYMMAHTERTPSGDARKDARKKVETGRAVLLKLKSTLSCAGLPKGDSSTRPPIEEFCGWVQTLYFDGISTDEHGAELRQLARSMNQETEKLLRDQVFVEEPADAPASAAPAVTTVELAREVLPGDPLVLKANTSPCPLPRSLTGIVEPLPAIGSSAGMEACRTVGGCTPTFARGVVGDWDDTVVQVPLGRDETPAVGWALHDDWLVTGVALRRSVSMAAAAAAAVAGKEFDTPSLLGLEVAQSAEDLQDDGRCTPIALLAWGDQSSGSRGKSSKKNRAGSASVVGAGFGPARWVLGWGLPARYIRITVLGTTASFGLPKRGNLWLGDLEVHAAYARRIDSSNKVKNGGGKTPRGRHKPPMLESFQAKVLKIEAELEEAVRLKVEEPPAQLEKEEAHVRLRKLTKKALSEFKVVFARDQSSAIELAKRTLSGTRGSWKPLLYSCPAMHGQETPDKAFRKSKSLSGTRLDWGVYYDGGLGCSPGLPAVGFDLWTHWIISDVTVSTGSAARNAGATTSASSSSSSKTCPVRLALEVASCARAFGRDELCTRVAEFESTTSDSIVTHTLTRPVHARFLRLVVLDVKTSSSARTCAPVEAEVNSVVFHGYDDT